MGQQGQKRGGRRQHWLDAARSVDRRLRGQRGRQGQARQPVVQELHIQVGHDLRRHSARSAGHRR